MKKKDEIKVCLVGSSGGHLTHLYMLKPFWKDKNRFWVTFDKEDARSLLDGGKVPLMKAVSDWQLSLEGVLKIGAEGKLPDLGENITVWGNETADESRSGSKKGLDLTGYLRMLLFVSYGSEPLFRMMDMMQMNIRKEQPDFLLEKCVCMVDAEAGFCGKPVFFSSGPWKTLRKTRFSVSGNYITKP